MSGAFATVPTRYVPFGKAEARAGARAVPVEQAVNLVYGGVPYAVMMTTPLDLEDFVLGFSFTEGIVEHVDEFTALSFEPHPLGVRALAQLAPSAFARHLARQRNMSGRTGCGVCGIQDLDALPTARAVQGRARVSPAALAKAVSAIERHQPLNEATRAVHAAAWFDLDGEHIASREDVGRHNALDKLIGALLRARRKPEHGFILITSRCSFEMVEKAAAFGASFMAAISAPTSLAIERAAALGVNLAAIVREDGFTAFDLEPSSVMEALA